MAKSYRSHVDIVVHGKRSLSLNLVVLWLLLRRSARVVDGADDALGSLDTLATCDGKKLEEKLLDFKDARLESIGALLSPT